MIDEEQMVLMALRYAIGKATPTFEICTSQILKHWHTYSAELRQDIKEELIEARQQASVGILLPFSYDVNSNIDSIFKLTDESTPIVANKVLQIVKDMAQVEKLSMHDKLCDEDLLLDELDMLEIVIDLEEVFKISIYDSEIPEISKMSISELITYICNKKDKKC